MSFTEFGQDFNRLTTTCTAAAVLTPAESDYYDENGMLSDGVETAEGKSPGKRYKSPEDSPRSEQSKVRILGKVERLPGRSRIGETGVTTYFLQDPSPFYCTVSKLIAITTFDIVLENESVALAKIVRRLEIREEDEF
ncbi:hypothetical protein HZH66_013757 [Vespula vulgaris]|uniref:Uncharacterized protein n=1 Tax=Vespula vulgaris TaxID=7454 RepID=A0A834MSJ0_VESVU|nr:hypothetical protein HZH66_013757 [Vespula vulgaris]